MYLELVDPAFFYCGADRLMLFCESVGEQPFIKTGFQQIVVRLTFGRKDRSAVIDERKDDRRIEALVLGLNMVSYTAVFDVCIESGYHDF